MTFTLQQLKSRLQAITKSDYRWSQLYEPLSSFKKSAVLIPISFDSYGIDDSNQHILVWLTKRSDKMRHDKGQVSFPGGMKDKNDKDAYAVALREAKEEIGLDKSQVETLGELPPVSNMRGLIITPILALVDPTFVPSCNSQEVEFTFRLPLSRFLSSSGHTSQKLEGIITPFFLHNFHDSLLPENYFRGHNECDINSGTTVDTDFNLNSDLPNNLKDINESITETQILKNISKEKDNLSKNGSDFLARLSQKFENIDFIAQNKVSSNSNSSATTEVSINTFGLTASLCIEVASGVFLKKPEFARFVDDIEESEYTPSEPWIHRINWIKKIGEKYATESRL